MLEPVTGVVKTGRRRMCTGRAARRRRLARRSGVDMDIGLPVIDGYESATRLLARLNATRLIALTGYRPESDRQKTRQTGSPTI
jgi:CheY-like chemotaxis protein